MLPVARVLLVLGASGVLFTLDAGAAMYKWVDENGKTHYADSVPPKYANRAGERLSKSGTVAKIERPAPVVEARPSEHEIEKQKAEAKRELERQRQDTALLSTYVNAEEIEQARERELRRHQETMRLATAGLARSNTPADRQKLDSLMSMGRQETDHINAKFDAQKARFRELTSAGSAAAAATIQVQAPAGR